MKIRARIDAQRFASRATEKQPHRAAPRRAGKNLAHFAQLLRRGRNRKLQKHGGRFSRTPIG